MAALTPTDNLTAAPDEHGRFGAFGGSFVPETLHAALDQLARSYDDAREDPAFWTELESWLRHYCGRPTPLFFARQLTVRGGGARIWLKREDLAHTGAHKINNSIGQALLTRRMEKHRIIAETGAGQHGVATATAAAVLGLECDVYMGAEDMRRQSPNVKRMQLLGARVVPVESGSRTLKDATNDAMRDWMASSETTHYIIGSVVGPHPFPRIVRDFQAVIGRECREQAMSQLGAAPDLIVACVGGGSNAAGIFYPFLEDTTVKMVGVEAGGRGASFGEHAAPLTFGSPGVLHGSLSYVMQDEDGQTAPVHSVSAGLDYPGVGPEHAYWRDTKRVSYCAVDDQRALEAFQMMAACEGIIPALETSHAVAAALDLAAEMAPEANVVINVSGRGDKDLDEAMRLIEGDARRS